MWFNILFGTWDYLLSAVGVDHLGSTWSGGSAFYSYHWDPSVVTMAGASLFAFPFILSLYHWWMVISYDGCLYHVWWMVLFILLYLYYGSEEDDVILFHTLWHVQWMIEHSGFHLPRGIRNKLYNINFGLSTYFFHVDVVVFRLRIN